MRILAPDSEDVDNCRATAASWKLASPVVTITSNWPTYHHLSLLDPFEIRKINQTELSCPVRLPRGAVVDRIASRSHT